MKGREFSKEDREKLSLAALGKPKSDLAKKNMSLAKLGTKRTPHSIETKQKMRESALSRRKIKND